MRQTTKDILQQTEKHLESISNQLMDELTKIIAGDWGLSKSATNDQVRQLDIEVFMDGYRLALYPMDSSSTQLGYKSLLKEAYSNGLLYEDALNPDLSLYDFAKNEDIQDLDEFDKAQREIFLKWFLNCWNKTPKTTLTKPVYLVFHDSGSALDLQSNKWVKNR